MSSPQRDLLEQVLHALPLAAVLLDAEGRCLLTNAAGQPLVERLPSLSAGLAEARASRQPWTGRGITVTPLLEGGELTGFLCLQSQRLSVLQALDDERARIATDVHDDSIQSLAAASLAVGLLRSRLEDAAPDQLPLVDRVQDRVNGASRRLRTLLLSLEEPDPEAGLAEVLESVLAFVLEDSPGSVAVEDVALGPHVRNQVLLIAKQVLLLPPARPGALDVEVTASGDGALVVIAHDGAPAEADVRRLQDRASAVGGWLVWEPGAGVRCWVPQSHGGG